MRVVVPATVEESEAVMPPPELLITRGAPLPFSRLPAKLVVKVIGVPSKISLP